MYNAMWYLHWQPELRIIFVSRLNLSLVRALSFDGSAAEPALQSAPDRDRFWIYRPRTNYQLITNSDWYVRAVSDTNSINLFADIVK